MEGKNIDKLFKDKLGNKEVWYDPANWEKMSAYLDRNPIVRKRPFLHYVIGSGLLALILLTGGYYYAMSSLGKEKEDRHKQKLLLQYPAAPENPAANTLEISSSGQAAGKKKEYSAAIAADSAHYGIPAGQSEMPADLQESVRFLTAENGETEDESEILNAGSPALIKKRPVEFRSSHKARVRKNALPEDDHLDNSTVTMAEEKNVAAFLPTEVPEEVEPLLTIIPDEISSSFSAHTGINNRPGWRLNTKKIKPFIDVYAGTGFMARPDHLLLKGGISIGIELNPTIFLRTGITFANQNTPRHAGYSFEKTVFGFGRDFDVYELQVDKTNSMSVPVEIGLRKNRHAIFAGVEIEKILASKGKFHLYPSGDAKILKESGWFGNRAFLPEPTWNFLLGYEYYIGPKTIIGARLESAMSNYISIKDEEEFRAPGASNWGRAIFQIRQKF